MIIMRAALARNFVEILTFQMLTWDPIPGRLRAEHKTFRRYRYLGCHAPANQPPEEVKTVSSTGSSLQT